jgi:integrase
MKNITQVVKSVKASVKDKDGIQMYPTRWNDDFIDMPIIDEEKRRKPSFTGEQVTKIVNGASGRVQMAAILLAATGLRAGELLGLECRHFDGSAIHVEQAAWRDQLLDKPKTRNAKRDIDLHPDAANLLKQLVGNRSTGLIFGTPSGKPLTQTNLLRREFHPLLKTLGIPRCGFHAFRRFRVTFLRKTICPDGLLKFWMGHANKDETDRYDRVREDTEFRKDVARSAGVGFELPKTLTSRRTKEGMGRNTPGISDVNRARYDRQEAIHAVSA